MFNPFLWVNPRLLGCDDHSEGKLVIDNVISHSLIDNGKKMKRLKTWRKIFTWGQEEEHA